MEFPIDILLVPVPVGASDHNQLLFVVSTSDNFEVVLVAVLPDRSRLVQVGVEVLRDNLMWVKFESVDESERDLLAVLITRGDFFIEIRVPSFELDLVTSLLSLFFLLLFPASLALLPYGIIFDLTFDKTNEVIVSLMKQEMGTACGLKQSDNLVINLGLDIQLDQQICDVVNISPEDEGSDV